jgi:hypothetical protein
MLKKLAFSLVAISILVFASYPLFAQGSIINADNVKTFLTVYADPAPEAIAAASADLGAGAADFGVLANKLIVISQMKSAGMQGDALKTQLLAMPAPATFTAEEIDYYNANEADIQKGINTLMGVGK